MADVNHNLFVKVLAQIEQHPETWKQRTYRCETGMCFAGWAAELSELRWESADSVWVEFEDIADGVHCSTAAGVLLGVMANVDDAAAEEGLDDGLFDGDNTLDDLYRISADLMGIDEQVLRDKVAAEVQS